MPNSEHEPSFFDDDPITPAEEKDLLKSLNDMLHGNVIIVPKSFTDEEFLRMLES